MKQNCSFQYRPPENGVINLIFSNGLANTLVFLYFNIFNILARMQEVHSPETKILRKVKKSREVSTQEAEEYLSRPIPKLNDPNKALKKSYDKGHLNDSKFEFIKELKDIRTKKKEDSISSHGGTDDEDFNIGEEQTRNIPKQDNIEEEQGAEKVNKKRRKRRFTVKVESQQKNEENTRKEDEVAKANSKEDNAKEIQERESQQTESKSAEQVQKRRKTITPAMLKERKITRLNAKSNQNEQTNIKTLQGQLQSTQKGKVEEEKVVEQIYVPKDNLSQPISKQANSQQQQVQQDQKGDTKAKQKYQQNNKQKRLTRKSLIQAEVKKEQAKEKPSNPQGKDIIKSRTKSRQKRVKFSAKIEDEKKPIQARRRNKQQSSQSKAKENASAQDGSKLHKPQTNVTKAPCVVRQRRAIRNSKLSTKNAEMPNQSNNALQSKVFREQNPPKEAKNSTEADKKGKLSINSKVVLESMSFFELKRKSLVKQKKKYAKRYYVQSQSDDQSEYPVKRHKSGKAKRYRKICIEQSNDSSDDIIDKRSRHSRKDKSRRKRRYSSSEMSEENQSQLFSTIHYHSRTNPHPEDPRYLKYELKQEQK